MMSLSPLENAFPFSDIDGVLEKLPMNKLDSLKTGEVYYGNRIYHPDYRTSVSVRWRGRLLLLRPSLTVVDRDIWRVSVAFEAPKSFGRKQHRCARSRFGTPPWQDASADRSAATPPAISPNPNRAATRLAGQSAIPSLASTCALPGAVEQTILGVTSWLLDFFPPLGSVT